MALRIKRPHSSVRLPSNCSRIPETVARRTCFRTLYLLLLHTLLVQLASFCYNGIVCDKEISKVMKINSRRHLKLNEKLFSLSLNEMQYPNPTLNFKFKCLCTVNCDDKVANNRPSVEAHHTNKAL